VTAFTEYADNLMPEDLNRPRFSGAHWLRVTPLSANLAMAKYDPLPTFGQDPAASAIEQRAKGAVE
jgi:hypothetical protein